MTHFYRSDIIGKQPTAIGNTFKSEWFGEVRTWRVREFKHGLIYGVLA